MEHLLYSVKLYFIKNLEVKFNKQKIMDNNKNKYLTIKANKVFKIN